MKMGVSAIAMPSWGMWRTMTSPSELAKVAEEIMPGAVVAQVEKLGRVGELHRPMTNEGNWSEPACLECFGGIFAVDPVPGRPCGCWGLLLPVCATCAVYSPEGHWSRPKWPCDTWKALIAENHSEVERCARGLVRTAHPEVGKREVVRQWWDALVTALGDDA
jgi:hypothetical protein